MKTLSSLLAASLLLPLLFSSCARQESVNVNQDTIYGEYRLVYEAASDKTFARATFRFGGATGTMLELSAPAEVMADSVTLGWKPLLAYYEASSASTDSVATFLYTDLDNNTFENKVLLARSIDFPAALDTVSQAAAYTLEWVGAPLATNESVIVTINGTGEGDARVFVQNTPASTSIILDKDKLAAVAKGEATIAMERYTVQPLQEGTSEGGAVWSRWIAEPVKILITE